MSFFLNPFAISPPLGAWLWLDGGQSNDAKGALFANIDWVAPYAGTFPQVQFWGDDGVWRSLDNTVDLSYQSPVDGTKQYAIQAYLYVALAAQLGCTALDPLYVVSQSVGDTSMGAVGGGYWSSTIPGTGYTDLVSRTNAAKAALTTLRGVAPRVVALNFDQGEKDGRDATDAANYAVNENTNWIPSFRTAIGEPNLRIVLNALKLGSINGSPNPVLLGGTINQAKEGAALADPTKIICVVTDYCEPSADGVHFTAAGQIVKCIGTGGTAGGIRSSQLQSMIDAGWIPGTPSAAVPSGLTQFPYNIHFVRFGDILDTLFAAANGAFRIGVTVWNPPHYGLRTYFSKFATTGNQRCFHFYQNGSTLNFNYYITASGTQSRGIQWTGLSTLYDGSLHTVEIRYDGSIATGNGLDRVSLYIDGALYTTGKTLVANTGALTNQLANVTAQLAVGAIVQNGGLKDSVNFVAGGWMKDFFVQDGTGAAQLTCPNLLTGTDTSGNGRNGTYV